MRTIAHVTHEAVHKVGGIGAVLDGLLTSKPYQAAEQRTILIGPLFTTAGPAAGRLGPDGEVLYSSLDGLPPHPVGEALKRIVHEYHVQIVYGHRTIVDPVSGFRVSPEVLLFDVSRMELNRLNRFKGQLWDAYGIDSTRYESSWEYDLYVKLALPAIAALRALGSVDGDNQCVIFAHEWMGLPTALAGMLDGSDRFRTIFHAHEVASMRRIVENHPGHDVMFYNLLTEAIAQDRYVDNVFGPQDDYYRHGLVRAARQCDRILAVGDHVVKELRFMGPAFADAPIDTAYNGIPAHACPLEEKRAGAARMRDYAEALLGDRPDYIFTHVTRMLSSKGLWRDIRVLEQLEPMFRAKGKSAVLFVLSTESLPRLPEDILRMEADYGWPVVHREGHPDLYYSEAIFYEGVQAFNARSRQIKIVYVNQFGWERAVCGRRMPADMSLLDIRRGSDVEFGQSIYEPFGIAQLEPLTYGAICVPSSVCGCVGFVEQVSGGEPTRNVLVADYCDLGRERHKEGDWLTLGQERRDRHEAEVAGRIAAELMKRLPTSETQVEKLMASGYALARQMSWDVVAKQYIMPAIEAACPPRHKIHVA